MSQFVPVNANIYPFSPLRLYERSLDSKVSAVFIGALVIAVSSFLAIPMMPVPVTMQTFAITVVGALYGWRLGGITVVIWLFAGAIGMPVFANGNAGLAYFIGPTSGYLLSFPIIAIFMGGLAERGWNGQRPGLVLMSALFANIVCLIIGAGRLALMIGIEKALLVGVLPFIIGCLIKACLAAGTLAVINWLWPIRARS